MNIIKSNGKHQTFDPNKIWKRIVSHSRSLPGIKPEILFQVVIPTIKADMSTSQIDEIIAFKAADLVIEHPDYSILGGRILMTRQAKIIGKECEKVDLEYDLFAATTFFRTYSLKNEEGNPIELPSMMYSRVANFLGNTPQEKEQFEGLLKSRKVSLATPIIVNAGTSRKGLISCALHTLVEDSTEGILKTLEDISQASREGSGIGLSVDSLRSSRSLVSSFKGAAGGIVRFADMAQSHMRFFKQGNRSGSCALYMSVWHRDIMEFLELRLPIGDEKQRARDLFTAVTINDNFMKALIEDKDWYLFCPSDLKKAGLKPFQDLWGDEYE